MKGGKIFFLSLEISVEKFCFFLESLFVELEGDAPLLEEIKNLSQIPFILDEGGEAEPLFSLGKEDSADGQIDDGVDHELC